MSTLKMRYNILNHQFGYVVATCVVSAATHVNNRHIIILKINFIKFDIY